MSNSPQTNFAFLEKYDPTLMRLGLQSECYFPDDPNTSLLKMRQYAEILVQLVDIFKLRFRIRQQRGGVKSEASQPTLAI
ncbi:MAG: hypothetical protein WCK35_13810 [Chloroflexota bacterium]